MASIKRFYNGGEKFEDVLLFSIPSGSDIHGLGRRHLIFPKQAFIEIDDEVEAGLETIRGNFAVDLLRKFGRRGLVMVDPRHDPATEDPERELPAKAPTDELAKERGAKLWAEYTMSVVQSHLADCEAARAAGGAPRGARDFTKHCLRLHKIVDPADRYMDSLKEGASPAAGQNDALLTILQQQMASTNTLVHALILQMASGQKVDPKALSELAAKMAPTETSAIASGPANGMPPVSGIVTGKTKPEPAGRETGLEVYDRTTRGKKERAQAAAAELHEQAPAKAAAARR